MANFDVVAKLSADISKFTSGMQKAGNAFRGMQDKTNRSVASIGQSVSNLGLGLTAALTAPLVGIATASVKAFGDFDTAVVGVAKTTDLAGADLENFKGQIMGMSREIPVSATELANIAEIAGQLGVELGDNNETIIGFTETIAAMGVATNMTSEEAATSMARFANVTKMIEKGANAGDDASVTYERLGSTVVSLGNNLATTESEIMSMAQRLAGTASVVGFTEAEILGLSGAMSSMGVEAQLGASTMQRVMTQMNNAVITGGEKLETFARVAGVSAEEFAQAWQTSPMEAMQMFIEGLGEVQESGGSTSEIFESLELGGVGVQQVFDKLAGNSELVAEAVDLANEAWEENVALTDEANAAYGSFWNQVKKLGNALFEAGTIIGSHLAPYLAKMSEAISNVILWFNDLDSATQGNIVKWGMLIAAIGPMFIIIGKLTFWLSTVGAKMKALGERIKVLGKTFSFLTSPTALAVMAILAIVVAIIYLWNTNEDFRNAVIEIWNNITSALSTAWEFIKSNAIAIWNGIKQAWSDLWESIRAVWDTFSGSLSAGWSAFWQGLTNSVQAIWNFLTTAWQVIWNTITAIWNAFKALLSGDWSAFWNTLKTSADAAWQGMKSLFNGLKEGLSQAWQNIKTAFNDWSTHWNNLKTQASTAWTNIKTAISTKAGEIWTSVKGKLSEMAEGWATQWEDLKTSASQKWEEIKTGAGEFVDGIGTAISEGWKTIQETWDTLWNGLTETVSGWVTNIGETLAPVVETIGGIWEGTKEVVGKAWEGTKEVVGNGVTWVSDTVSTGWNTISNAFSGGGEQVVASAQTTADAVTESSAGVESAQLHYQALADGSIVAIDQMTGIGTKIGEVSTDVNQRSQEIENAKQHYENLRALSVASITQMQGEIGIAYSRIQNEISTRTTSIETKTTEQFTSMKSKVVEQVNAMKSDIDSAMSSIQSTMSSKWSSIKSNTTNSVTSMKTTVQNGFNSMKSTTTSGINSMASTISNGMSRILANIRSTMSSAVSAMRSAAGQAQSAGAQMGAGFLAGLNSMSGSIIARARSIANAAAAAMRSALAIHSPSRVTEKIGEQTGEGFDGGLANMIRPTEKIARNLASAGIPMPNLARQGAMDMGTIQTAGGNPAEIRLILGGSEYRTFVSDISAGQQAELRHAY